MESKLLIQVKPDGLPYIKIKSSSSEDDLRDQMIRLFLAEACAGPVWLQPVSQNYDTGELTYNLIPLTNKLFLEKWPQILAHANVLTNWPEGVAKDSALKINDMSDTKPLAQNS